MLAIKHFRMQVVRPALDQLKLYSVAAEELLVITCAQESVGGTYLMQNDSRGFPVGPALGIYQMEGATYRDLWDNFLSYQTMWLDRLHPGETAHPNASRMIYDLRYATMIARLNYYRMPAALPQDFEGQIRYYKKYWNTDLGAATLDEVRRSYTAFTGVKV
jgi:hypothetical protein